MVQKMDIDSIGYLCDNVSSSFYISEYSGLDVFEYSEECPSELIFYIVRGYAKLIQNEEMPDIKSICSECIDFFYEKCLEDTEHSIDDIADEYIYDMYILPCFEEYYDLFEDLVRNGLNRLKLTYSEELFDIYFGKSSGHIFIYNDAQIELDIRNAFSIGRKNRKWLMI